VEAESPREKTISVSHLDDIIPVDPRHAEAAGHHFGPYIEVLTGIAHHGGLAGGSGRSVHPNDFAHGNGKHPEGVIVTQISLRSERKLCQVINAADIGRDQSGFLHLTAVGRDGMIYPLHGLCEPRRLEATYLVARGTFDRFVPDHTASFFLLITPITRMPPGQPPEG